MHISVCICTYQRPAPLKRLLAELAKQETKGLFTFSVIVADNDSSESGRAVISDMAGSFPVELTYCVEPRKNIALARNKAVSEGKGEAIAFIDDDEFPTKEWLMWLHKTSVDQKVSGVCAPVEPHFDEQPPAWIIKGGFCSRSRHKTGFVMDWRECRTGNVLLLRKSIEGMAEPFDAEFGGGGEDVDFFRRMVEKGHRFVWCDEAIVYEVVAPSRWKRSYMLRRGLLRGGNSLKHPGGRVGKVVKSMLAVPVYGLALPCLFVAGQPLFMKVAIKLSDHIGRLLTLLGVNPIKEREM